MFAITQMCFHSNLRFAVYAATFGFLPILLLRWWVAWFHWCRQWLSFCVFLCWLVVGFSLFLITAYQNYKLILAAHNRNQRKKKRTWMQKSQMGRLELDAFCSPFQSKPFYYSVTKNETEENSPGVHFFYVKYCVLNLVKKENSYDRAA